MPPIDATDVTESEVLELGRTWNAASKNWHMHVLSPGCRLNDRNAHAIVLENSDDGVTYVAYSSAPMKETACILAALVHGKEAVRSPSSEESEPESPQVRKMIQRAKALMALNIHWHHHIFFPTCAFNPSPGKWTILFEDPESSELLTSVTDAQPVNDIGITERLYYAQK